MDDNLIYEDSEYLEKATKKCMELMKTESKTHFYQNLIEASKTWSTNIELIINQYLFLLNLSYQIPIHYIIHVLQYVSHIIASYASHTALKCATFLNGMNLHLKNLLTVTPSNNMYQYLQTG